MSGSDMFWLGWNTAWGLMNLFMAGRSASKDQWAWVLAHSATVGLLVVLTIDLVVNT